MSTEKSSPAVSGVPRPSPDPFYTLRPHAGDVTAVQYLNLGTNGGIASGYATNSYCTTTAVCVLLNMCILAYICVTQDW